MVSRSAAVAALSSCPTTAGFGRVAWHHHTTVRHVAQFGGMSVNVVGSRSISTMACDLSEKHPCLEHQQFVGAAWSDY